MAPSHDSQPLTDYERKRLENIKRNQQMMSSFNLHSGATGLFSSSKRLRTETNEYNKIVREKKPTSDQNPNPNVTRLSLRPRRIPPDSTTNASSGGEVLVATSSSVTAATTTTTTTEPKCSPRKLGPVSMRDAYISNGRSSPADNQHQQQYLIDTIKGFSEKTSCSISSKRDDGTGDSVLDLKSLILKPENIARLMPAGITILNFFPSKDRSLIVAGNKYGNVAFWDVDRDHLNNGEEENEDDNGIYLYGPHSGPISGIMIPPFSLTKVYTSSYDGCLRLLDIEKESFYLVYSSEDDIFCLSHRPCEAKSLYFGEARGVMNVWDERVGKSSSSWELHDQRINTIDFHPENTNWMATSSTDGTACIWDLRSINANRPKTLKMVDHKRAVHSAYFSPSGSCLATTSISNKVGLLRGVDFLDISMINHDNQVSKWPSSFRAIWGWDDSYLFIGSKKMGVDVISTSYRKMVTLESSYLSAYPYRFAAHPYKIGMLAGATSGGQVYTWISQQEL